MQIPKLYRPSLKIPEFDYQSLAGAFKKEQNTPTPVSASHIKEVPDPNTERPQELINTPGGSGGMAPALSAAFGANALTNPAGGSGKGTYGSGSFGLITNPPFQDPVTDPYNPNNPGPDNPSGPIILPGFDDLTPNYPILPGMDPADLDQYVHDNDSREDYYDEQVDKILDEVRSGTTHWSAYPDSLLDELNLTTDELKDVYPVGDDVVLPNFGVQPANPFAPGETSGVPDADPDYDDILGGGPGNDLLGTDGVDTSLLDEWRRTGGGVPFDEWVRNRPPEDDPLNPGAGDNSDWQNNDDDSDIGGWVWYDHDNDPSTAEVFGPPPGEETPDTETPPPVTGGGIDLGGWLPGVEIEGLQDILDLIGIPTSGGGGSNPPPTTPPVNPPPPPEEGWEAPIPDETDGRGGSDQRDGDDISIPEQPQEPVIDPETGEEIDPVTGEPIIDIVIDPTEEPEDPDPEVPEEPEEPDNTGGGQDPDPIDDDNQGGPPDGPDIIIDPDPEEPDDDPPPTNEPPEDDDVSSVGDFFGEFVNDITTNFDLGGILEGGINIYGAAEQADAIRYGANRAWSEISRQFDKTRDDLKDERDIGDKAIREGLWDKTTRTLNPDAREDLFSINPDVSTGVAGQMADTFQGFENLTDFEGKTGDWANGLTYDSPEGQQLISDYMRASENAGKARGRMNTQETKDSTFKSYIRALDDIENLNAKRQGQEVQRRTTDFGISSGQRSQEAGEQLSETQVSFAQNRENLDKVFSQLFAEEQQGVQNRMAGNQQTMDVRNQYWQELLGMDSQEFEKFMRVADMGANASARTGQIGAASWGPLSSIAGAEAGANADYIGNLTDIFSNIINP